MNPYVQNDTLLIPSDSDKKYHWWNGGQGVIETLYELQREDLIPEYKSNLYALMLGGPVKG